jgi:hypothetical protein
MTVMSFPNVVVSFKKAMYEYLKGYFDGAKHYIDGTEYNFPDCNIEFEIDRILNPAKLTIALIGNGTFTQRELKCENQRLPGKPAYELRADVRREVIIATPVTTSGNKRQTVDNCWGLLYGVFTQRPLLAERGIYLPVLTPINTDLTSRSDMAEASGTLTCEVRVSYGRFN